MGVDCGATNLRVGVLDQEGNVFFYSKVPSPLKTNPQNFAKIVKDQLTQLASQDLVLQLQAMGVGTPGPLDMEKGLILLSPNLGNKESIDLKTHFDREFSIPVYFDRDTNLALLGEAWMGAAVGVKDVVMLTVGTGVGGAVMVNGQIEHGAHGKAGEIGHMIIEIQNLENQVPKCGLGHQGCLEALINSTQDLDELGTYLGYGLANIVDIFNPQKIIIGGGKVNLGDFLPKAVGVMKELGMKGAVDEVQVTYAKLGDRSGVYGGARLVHDHYQNKTRT